MTENNQWKESEVVIPERTSEPVDHSQTNTLLSPATGDISGGLDGIGKDLKEVVKDSKPKVDIAAAVTLVEIEGRKEHVEQFKIVSRSQFGDNEMGAVEAPCGLPIGMVYVLIGEAQKHYSDLDLTKDKIIVNVKLRSNCKKCRGKGHVGRLFDKVTHKITDKLLKCICLKTVIEIGKDQLEEETSDADSSSES